MAVSRTPKARGRISRLIVSITISTGTKGVGVPSGRRCPRDIVGWFRIPINTVASQRGKASPMFIDSCVVGVNVYGRRPSMFMERRKSMSDSVIVAHLCPSLFTGIKSCLVNIKIVQA